MKKLIYSIFTLMVFSYTANAQNIVKHALQGFDSLCADIAHGKIDSIYYESNQKLLAQVEKL